MKTRDRIIHAALALFNQHGEPNITTNHIAADLGISPGNLYYHFRNKEAIIHSIFDQYAQDLALAFDPSQPRDDTQALLQHYLDATFSLMWRYRFFYANLPDILRRDDALQQKYLGAQQQLQTNLMTILHHYRQAGWLSLNDRALSAIGETLKQVASSWIFYQSAQAPQTQIHAGVIYKGVLQMLALLHPLTSAQGQMAISALIDHYEQQLVRQDSRSLDTLN
ncbi:TetR/AcrR family transcriptional regulator [Salinivibrio kushneri]|uniref:TetR/AcrR family transcriptional regulator n=1 Tax=Salinivibrio kushneri TaxID=1908198 RepID=A0AA47KKZ3_9GAMM|nr:TetR/AcrR family transcriptional regulator [Salinivibrio kushneri]WBA08799.1 TetR/AcrR family transcriptional regulator [Salinivibrio kushneri]